MTTHVFISYSTIDRAFVDRLRDDLSGRGLDIWQDTQNLKPGTYNWEYAIREAIQAARAVLYIATPTARRSNYVQDELAIAEMYERLVLPVWAKGEHWIDCVPMGLGRVQHADARDEARYAAALEFLVEELGGSVPRESPPPPTATPPDFVPRNPYKGLRAFQEADSGDFFGRDALIRQLIAMLSGQTAERFLAVIGASGAGKSSVVRAGLLPKLKQGALPGSDQWVYLPPLVPGRHPLENLALALRHQSGGSVADILKDLNSPSTRGLHWLTAGANAERVVLLIDQFEELFTLTSHEDERRQFIDVLTTAATEPDGAVLPIITLRADFYERPMSYRDLARLVEANNKSVLPLTITELYEAISKPAELDKVRLTFDLGLMADIVFELREEAGALAGALPLLQFTLERLFARREGQRLTRTAYDAIGGVRGAIGHHADEVFATLDDDARDAFPRVFWRLVSVDESETATRRRAYLAEFADGSPERRLIDALTAEKARLLLADQDEDGHPTVEVAHEALLRSWGRLADWIESAAEQLQQLRKVEDAAAEWDANERRAAFYWPDERLQPVYDLIAQLDIAVSPLVAAFIEPEAKRLLRELNDLPHTPDSHEARRDIGDRLSVIGDPCPGVGVITPDMNDPFTDLPVGAVQTLPDGGLRLRAPDGTPDIVWLPVAPGGEIEINGQIFTVEPFYIAKYLVTYAQFRAFEQADYDDDRWWQGMPEKYRQQELEQPRTKSLNNPRDSISWYQSVAFGRWLDATYRELGLSALTPNPSPRGEGLSALTPNPSPQGEGLKDYREMAAKVMVDIARDLRQRQTSAEQFLWECLRDRRLNNFKFRRQHPVANTAYVVDFYCHEARLVVEVDGGVHDNQQQDDQRRQQALEALGLTVMRFSNDAVFNTLEQVLIDIQRAAAFPLAPGRGGQGVRAEDWQIRLPTEWEWQWAAQNGTEGREYPWEGGQRDDGRCNTFEAGLSRAVAVGLYPHGAAACGALDMAGNLYEWCLNKYEDPADLAVDASAARRVLRGGSWNSSHSYARAASRNYSHPHARANSRGFRLWCVRAPSQSLVTGGRSGVA